MTVKELYAEARQLPSEQATELIDLLLVDTYCEPDPAIEEAAHDLGVTTNQLLMVGDSSADMNAAKAAGAPAALVGWGYGHVQAQSQGPWWQIDRPQQLTALWRALADTGAPGHQTPGGKGANGQ